MMWFRMSTSPQPSNALRISDDTVPGIGEAKRGSEGKTSRTNPRKKQPNDGGMGSTVYLMILMQHVVPELGLAVVIVATGKPANPIRLQPVMAKCIHHHLLITHHHNKLRSIGIQASDILRV
jgi:hypothetical protein